MKASKKLIIASVSLIAAASLAVGATFAWFSYQSNVGLGSVQFAVDSGDENLVVAVTSVGGATTPSSFSYSLTTNTIKSCINGGTPVLYKPLTVKDDGNDTVSETNAITLLAQDEESTPGAGDYAAFDLVFRYTPVTGSAQMPNLILDFGSEINAVNPSEGAYQPKNKVYAWTPSDQYGDTSFDKDDEIIARASNAARIAFLYQDSGVMKNKVWAPNEALAGGMSAEDTPDSPKGFYKGNLANDYERHMAGLGVDTIVPPTYASRVYTGLQTQTAEKNNFNYSTIAQFPALQGGNTYSELKITVKVWLEGKDGDCLPTVLGDEFAFLLKFRTSTIK